MDSKPTKTTRGQRPLCLNNLAESVMSFLRMKQVTTFQEVADYIVAKIGHQKSEPSAEKTTRRRVYDVLNVFLASELITKENKSIRYQSLVALSDDSAMPPNSQDLARVCKEKQEQLVRLIRLLLAYKALIARNEKTMRPPTAIPVPFIIVGFNSNIAGGSKAALNGKKLEMYALANPSFYSPMDVFKLNFSDEVQRQVLREIPELAACESLVFPPPPDTSEP